MLARSKNATGNAVEQVRSSCSCVEHCSHVIQAAAIRAVQVIEGAAGFEADPPESAERGADLAAEGGAGERGRAAAAPDAV